MWCVVRAAGREREAVCGTDASQHTHIHTLYMICYLWRAVSAAGGEHVVCCGCCRRRAEGSITHHIYSVCGVYMCAWHSTCHNTHTYTHAYTHYTHYICGLWYVVCCGCCRRRAEGSACRSTHYNTHMYTLHSLHMWCVMSAAGGEREAVRGNWRITTHTHIHTTHNIHNFFYVTCCECCSPRAGSSAW